MQNGASDLSLQAQADHLLAILDPDSCAQYENEWPHVALCLAASKSETRLTDYPLSVAA
jgi:hypothetical protein